MPLEVKLSVMKSIKKRYYYTRMQLKLYTAGINRTHTKFKSKKEEVRY